MKRPNRKRCFVFGPELAWEGVVDATLGRNTKTVLGHVNPQAQPTFYGPSAKVQ